VRLAWEPCDSYGWAFDPGGDDGNDGSQSSFDLYAGVHDEGGLGSGSGATDGG
jgi:hypothetical protein